jgi:hypothetical protein
MVVLDLTVVFDRWPKSEPPLTCADRRLSSCLLSSVSSSRGWTAFDPLPSLTPELVDWFRVLIGVVRKGEQLVFRSPSSFVFVKKQFRVAFGLIDSGSFFFVAQ